MPGKHFVRARYHSVVIIGGGIAGLRAASVLLKEYPDLLLVEASPRIGGRVQQVEGVVAWPVEIGPEFIHGAKTSLKALIEETNSSLREFEWPDCWYFGKERRLISSNVKDPDLKRVHELFASVGEEQHPEPDISAAEWLRQHGASQKMLAIAEACYANDFGCSLEQLGLSEMITENQRWDSGDTYLVLDRSLRNLVQHLAAGLEQNLALGWPVYRIEYNSRGAKVFGPADQVVKCRHVIITVPILALQKQTICFSPALPSQKMDAIARVKMSNAVKVILAFSRPFWPKDFFDVVCTDCFIPEFWVTSYPATSSDPDPAELCCITGFVAGSKAEEMSGMSHTSIIIKALSQLDEIFGSKANRHPAASLYVRGYVVDWSRSPFIGGAYSYPSLGARIGDRDKIAQPVGRVLFFAGEATHPAVNPCLQAALETGERAAKEVLSAARMPASRL